MAEPEPLVLPIASPKTQKAEPKLLSNFHCKTIFFIVLIALLPLIPSQAPDFVNQSILSKGWELIHLLFVGIAISYGLFSRRNPDPETHKEASLKPDTPQSYVSKLLHVSSVFEDDEADTPRGFPDAKIQTWSSQYHPGDPMVVSSKKPLSLPIRSLKSPSQGPESIESCETLNGSLVSRGNMKETVVLPSPIPWKSRSGRMEVKDEIFSSGMASPPSKTPSLPSEMVAKTSEDSMKKKRFYRSTPPPAPPPPPTPPGHGPISISEIPESRKTFKEELKDLRQARSVRTVRWKEEPEKTESPPQPQTPPLPHSRSDEVIVPSDSESESGGECSDAENGSSSVVEAETGENEVDKKADEFIAKFREQIRLQRIESIKRSSGHRSARKK